MTSQHHIVGGNDMIPDGAVMCDMGIGKKNAVIANFCVRLPLCRAGIHRYPFADQTVTANREGNLFALIFQILWRMADRSEGIDRCTGAYRGFSRDDDMRNQMATLFQHDLRPNMAEGANVHLRA
jgi:hypothetical protein